MLYKIFTGEAGKNFLFFLVFIFLFLHAKVAAQKEFRNRTVKFECNKNASRTDFVIPPSTKIGCKFFLKKENAVTYKKRFRYQRVIIRKLSSVYTNCLSELNNSKIEFDRREINSSELWNRFAIRVPGEKIGNYGTLYSSADRSTLVIELDYGEMLQKSPCNIEDKFIEIADDLLFKLERIEKQTITGKQVWPTSVCQDILEKIFEMVPYPQSTALLRYGYKSGDSRSVMLLSPKFILLIDSTQRTEDVETEFFKYQLKAFHYIQFSRSQIADGSVRISTKPLQNIVPGSYPGNLVATRVVLLASNSDIQASAQINSKRYVSWYEGILKETSSFSRPIHPQADQIDRYNSYLLFSDNIADFFISPNNGLPPPAPVKAVYGKRAVITPMMFMYANGLPILVKVNTSLAEFIAHYSITGKYSLYRRYNGNYAEVTPVKTDLILLPSDKLIF